MNSKNFLKFAVIGLTAGLFISAQSATANKNEKEVAAPKKEVVIAKKEVTPPQKEVVPVEKKEAVATEKKEVSTEAEVIAPKSEITTDKEPTDKKEVAMMKSSNDATCEAVKTVPVVKESGSKIVKDTSGKSDKGCGCGDPDKTPKCKGAAKTVVEG